MSELQNEAQSFFFSLPDYMRIDSYKVWAEHFTRIDHFLRALPFSLESYRQGKKMIAEEIRDFFPKCDKYMKSTALHFAVSNGDINLVALLKEYCPELLSQTDWLGSTPYQIAKQKGKAELTCLLDPANKEVEQAVHLICSMFADKMKIVDDKGALPVRNGVKISQ